jgi:hypothetical protein
LPLREGRLGRNVDRYGFTQASGLLRDGFPLVGVLHLVVNAPGPAEHVREVERWRVVDEDRQLIEFEEKMMMDMTGSWAADLQIKRLGSHITDDRVGYNALALQLRGEGRWGFQPFPSYGRQAMINRDSSQPLLDAVKLLADEVQPFAPRRN